MRRLNSRWAVLFVLSIAELFAFTLWFSVNAIVPQLAAIWVLTGFEISLLNIVVQIGFVVGAFISSLFNLPDIFKTRNVFIWSALLGGATNFFITYFVPPFLIVLFLRFLTGCFLAGVYPTAMKLLATWFKKGRGFAIGILIAGLSIGSGLPYLFNLTGIPDWRLILNISTVCTVVSTLLVWLYIEEGPYKGQLAKFELSKVKQIWQNKALRLAYFGYFGHMWELYAMLVWIPFFLRDAFLQTNPTADPTLFFSTGTFFVFSMGAIATGVGGTFADKYGRTIFNILMLIGSGACSLIIGFAFSYPYLALLIALTWGILIIPDSPQYSAMTTELADPDYVGTALALQTTIGFLLTVISIQLIPLFVAHVSWSFGFVILAPGPFFGVISLYRLRQQNDSLKIALGRK